MAISHIKSNTVPDWTGTVTIGNSTGGTQTVAATDLVRPGDWNSAHNQYYTLSGNTTGASTASGTNVVFQASNNLTIAGSTGTIVFVGPVQDVLSYYQHPPVLNNTATMSVGGGSSVYVQPFIIPQDISASYIRMPVSMSLASTTFATGAAAYGSSVAQSNTLFFNIYTQGTGANSQSLRLLSQATATWNFMISYSGTASTHSVSYNVSWPQQGGSSSTQMTTNQPAGSSAVNEVPAGTSNFQSFRYLDIPFVGSLSAGNYWMGLQRSSTTAGGSNIGLGVSALMVTQHNSSIGIPNQASSASNHLVPYLGLWSTNSLGQTSSSMAKSHVSTVASHPVVAFQIIREA